MVYGMSEKFGLVNYAPSGENYQKPYSEATEALIDAEVRNIVDKCYLETKQLIESKRDVAEVLAKRLLEKEVITLPDIIECLGPRPFPMKETLRDYLEEIEK